MRRIEGSRITEKNLIPKSIFAMFGHLTSFANVARDQAAQRQAFLFDLQTVSRHAFKLILSNDYDIERHQWIKSDDQGSGRFSTNFTAVLNQLEKEHPSFSTNRAKVFPRMFAAIMAVTRDALSGKYESQSEDFAAIIEICGVSETFLSEDQIMTFDLIERKLKAIYRQTAPEWAITYYQNKPIIRTDKSDLFTDIDDVREFMKEIDGRYIMYRRAFRPKSGGYDFIRDYVSIINHSQGPLFRWDSKVGENAKPRSINGVVLVPKDAIWLLGHDTFPMSKIFTLCIGLKGFIDYCRGNNIKGGSVRGIALSNSPEETGTVPLSRNVVMKADVEGGDFFEDFENRSEFLREHEVSKVLSEDELRYVNASR